MYEDLIKCSNYGKQKLQGIERGSQSFDGSRDIAIRDIAKNKITAQLRDISLFEHVWVHDKQLSNSSESIERPVSEDGKKAEGRDENGSLGLNTELTSDDRKFLQLLHAKNWSDIAVMKEGGYVPSKDVLSSFDTNGLSRTEKLILDVVCGSVETNNRGLVKNYMDKNSSLINKGTVDLNMG